MADKELYDKAEEIVNKKIEFYHHLYSYITVNVILAILNIFFSPNEWWFYWITIFWGIGLIFHFLRAFVFYKRFDGKYREDMIEKEMEKMKK